MPNGRGGEMVKTLQEGSLQGRTSGETKEKEGSSFRTPPPPPPPIEKEEPTGKKLQTNATPGSQVPKTSEHPRTPAPWARRRGDREPARKMSSSSSLTYLSEETETSAAAGGNPQSWPRDKVPQSNKRAKSLYLNPPEKAQAADVLEQFLSHFLTFLRECPDRPHFQDTKGLVSSSTHEYEKFSRPGEFEIQLSFPVTDPIQYTEVESYTGLFHRLTLTTKSHSFPASFLLEDKKTLSPRNFVEEFRKNVDQFIRTFYSVPFLGWQIKLEKKKSSCPAVSLVMRDSQEAKLMSLRLAPALEMAAQSPCMKKAKDLLKEEKYLPLMRVFYFVAEQPPGRLNKDTWKISFSHVEEEILNRHWSSKACCRKECLKMLDDFVDGLKTEYPQMLFHLSSYHTRTSYLHTLWEWRKDEDWKPSEVSQCFSRVLADFTHAVATAHLIHFFLPQCNLFSDKFFPPTKLRFLCARLREKEGTVQAFTVSRRKACSALVVNPDVSWPIMITLGLVALVSLVLPHVAL